MLGEGGEIRPDDILPPGCPVTPLGHSKGTYWFSDPEGQVRAHRTFRSGELASLFLGRTDWLFQHFGIGNRTDKLNDLQISATLIRACVAAGPFDGSKIRGPGIWWERERTDTEGRPGAIVIHCGDTLYRAWFEGGRFVLGPRWAAGKRIGAWVYQYSAPLPGLADAAATEQEMEALRRFLATWNWAGGEDDAYLMLGLHGIGFIPGLLRHRPIGLIEGDTGCGKSTLFDLVETSHGGGAIRLENGTAAYLRETLAGTRAAQLIILNEFEAKAGGNGRADELTEFLRFAYAREGNWGRGGRDGADGEAPDVSGLVGATMAPAVSPADQNRRIILRLQPLKVSAEDLVTLDHRVAAMAAMGPAIRRRLLEGWPRFIAAYGAYQAAMVKDGHAPRTITTWGTVLAVADVLGYDRMDPARLERWTERLRRDRMTASTPAKAPAEVLSRLINFRIEEYRGSTKHTVLEYILEAIDLPRPDETLAVCKRIGITLADVRVPDPDNPHFREAREMGGELPTKTQRFLAVSTTVPGIEEIFRNTVYAGGLWRQQLLKLDGARTPESPIRFGSRAEEGGRSKEIRSRQAVLVPLKHLGILDVGADGQETLVDGGEGGGNAPTIAPTSPWAPGADWGDIDAV